MLNLAANLESMTVTRNAALTSRKLIYAAVLVLALLPLASVPAEAGPIMLTYSGDSESGCSGETTCSNYYSWGTFPEGYSFLLEFDAIYMDSLEVWIDDRPMSETDFQGRLPSSLSDYDCLPLVTSDTPCRDFSVSGSEDGSVLLPPPGSTTWEGYHFTIAWDRDTEALGFPNDPGDRVRVLHERGRNLDGSLDSDNLFDYDMCDVGEGCVYTAAVIDPSIRTGDTDFHTFAPSYLQPVPEPSSLILLGTGVSGWLFRRRRRTKV